MTFRYTNNEKLQRQQEDEMNNRIIKETGRVK